MNETMNVIGRFEMITNIFVEHSWCGKSIESSFLGIQ